MRARVAVEFSEVTEAEQVLAMFLACIGNTDPAKGLLHVTGAVIAREDPLPQGTWTFTPMKAMMRRYEDRKLPEAAGPIRREEQSHAV